MHPPLSTMDRVRQWLTTLARSLEPRICEDAARNHRWPRNLVLSCSLGRANSVSRSCPMPAVRAKRPADGQDASDQLHSAPKESKAAEAHASPTHGSAVVPMSGGHHPELGPDAISAHASMQAESHCMDDECTHAIEILLDGCCESGPEPDPDAIERAAVGNTAHGDEQEEDRGLSTGEWAETSRTHAMAIENGGRLEETESVANGPAQAEPSLAHAFQAGSPDAGEAPVQILPHLASGPRKDMGRTRAPPPTELNPLAAAMFNAALILFSRVTAGSALFSVRYLALTAHYVVDTHAPTDGMRSAMRAFMQAPAGLSKLNKRPSTTLSTTEMAHDASGLGAAAHTTFATPSKHSAGQIDSPSPTSHATVIGSYSRSKEQVQSTTGQSVLQKLVSSARKADETKRSPESSATAAMRPTHTSTATAMDTGAPQSGSGKKGKVASAQQSVLFSWDAHRRMREQQGPHTDTQRRAAHTDNDRKVSENATDRPHARLHTTTTTPRDVVVLEDSSPQKQAQPHLSSLQSGPHEDCKREQPKEDERVEEAVTCPVCGARVDASAADAHVNAHFEPAANASESPAPLHPAPARTGTIREQPTKHDAAVSHPLFALKGGASGKKPPQASVRGAGRGGATQAKAKGSTPLLKAKSSSSDSGRGSLHGSKGHPRDQSVLAGTAVVSPAGGEETQAVVADSARKTRDNADRLSRDSVDRDEAARTAQRSLFKWAL
jgi:hypothetical protein